MQLTLEFREKFADLRPAITVLQDAIHEVMTCDVLREVFYITLLTGNIINGVSLNNCPDREIPLYYYINLLHTTGWTCR